jgi:predicted AAA+ superfamily ATPase
MNCSGILNMIRNRYLVKTILADLKDKKMVFLGGPRQVGKTTLASQLITKHFSGNAYFNWDNREDRKDIMRPGWPGDVELVLLDELHKYKRWKTFIKGEYDKYKDRLNFMLTGSAHMDIYRKGGDSLQGRYHYFRLHPFSVAELENGQNSFIPFKELDLPVKYPSKTINTLDQYGGFPEPFVKSTMRFSRRWHIEKIDRMFREDIQDVSVIRDLGSMKLLADMLPERVGSLLSTNALREDLEVSFRAVARWLDILESFYYHFRIYPHTSKHIASLKKEPKLYLWDWSEVEDESKRFENLVAAHLLKFTHFLYDCEGYKAELSFLRDLNKKEVDFLVTVKNKPWFAVEVKRADTSVAPSLKIFKEKWKIPFCYQVIKKPKVDRMVGGIRVVSADRFLSGLV